MKKLLLPLLILLLPFQASANDEHFIPKQGTEALYVVNDVLVASKAHPLPKTYAPITLEDRSDKLYLPAQKAWEKMRLDAKKAGLNLYNLSGYRSYQTQKGLFARYAKAHGYQAANQFSALAGQSEHQTGLALDIGDRAYPELTLEETFGKTKAGLWLAKNATNYGFILRYPKGEEKITGYQYEPWHFRYVGKAVSSDMKKVKAKTLEAYLGLENSLGRKIATPKKMMLSGPMPKETTIYMVGAKAYVSLDDFLYLTAQANEETCPYLTLENENTLGFSREKPIFERKTTSTTPKKGLRTAIPYKGTITLNNWQLSKQAFQIDKTTYLELRYFTQSFGYQIDNEQFKEKRLSLTENPPQPYQNKLSLV